MEIFTLILRYAETFLIDEIRETRLQKNKRVGGEKEIF